MFNFINTLQKFTMGRTGQDKRALTILSQLKMKSLINKSTPLNMKKSKNFLNNFFIGVITGPDNVGGDGMKSTPTQNTQH